MSFILCKGVQVCDVAMCAAKLLSPVRSLAYNVLSYVQVCDVAMCAAKLLSPVEILGLDNVLRCASV